MSSSGSLREFISQRLTAAAEEIFTEFEKTIVQYEEEIDRQRRLLEITWKPQIKLHRTELQHHFIRVANEVLPGQQLCNQDRNLRLDQKEPDPPQVKDGQVELKQETDIVMVTPTSGESGHSEPEPNMYQVQLQISPVTGKPDHQETKYEQSTRIEDAGTDMDNSPMPESRGDSDAEHQHDFILNANEVLPGQQLCNQDMNLGLDQKEPDPPQIKEEMEDGQVELKQETDVDYLNERAQKMDKRTAYEAQFKLKAISYAEEHGNRAAARKFKINESMVRKWRKLEDKLRQVKKTQLSFRGHKARWPDLEERLEQWIMEQRAGGRRVSTVTIRLKAIKLAEEMKIEHFQGGPSWCDRFMKRCHLSIRTGTPVLEKRPADHIEKLANFRSYCSKHISDKHIQPSHITNMDEVPLTFDIPVDHTEEWTGTSTVATCTAGYEKLSFTVVLGCHADGQKLPPMVIFKRKTLPKETFPAGVIIKANEKGWMDEEMMKEWLRQVYVRRPGGFFYPPPSLLICDSLRAHLRVNVKKEVKQMNAVLAVIPRDLTKELQPLDVGVNWPFKMRLRAAWERWMIEGDHSYTKSGKQRRPSYATICGWIVDAWANVSAGTVVRAFAKAGIISEVPHGTESDSDSEESWTGTVDLAELFNAEDEEFDEFD